MSVYKDDRSKQWRYRRLVTLPDGSKERISGTPEVNTKVAAEMAEREHIARLLAGVVEKKEAPTFAKFAADFMAYASTNNKHSEIASKEQIIRTHLGPDFGSARLDAIGPKQIEIFKAKKLAEAYAPKTINNFLIVLHRLLALAHEYGEIAKVPHFKWMKAPKPDFDFLTFDEALQLERGAEGIWLVMITLARHAGLRQGELLGLEWTDLDLDRGLVRIQRAYVRGRIGTPKSGKGREVPLNGTVVAALRTLPKRSGVVFVDDAGKRIDKARCKWPLWSACKKAGLRRIGWHVLRHTFASHLAMRGAPLKAIQELMGHADINQTMRYMHLSPDVRMDAVRLLEVVPTSCQQLLRVV